MADPPNTTTIKAAANSLRFIWAELYDFHWKVDSKTEIGAREKSDKWSPTRYESLRCTVSKGPLLGEPMQSLISIKQSEQRSDPITARDSLISDWLMRLALNSGVALEPGTRAVYMKLWTESFADLNDATVDAAFQKTLLTWGSDFGKVGKLPTVGDIRGHLDASAKKELASRADLEWQKLLDYIR
jgi:hypothetical protein